jgi:heme/copper-type cytochrome/quinol oxidase subunit 4
MTLKLIIGFLLSTLLLVVSEYILLEELFSGKRTAVLAASLTGIVGAALCFIYFFNRYHNALKQS